MEAWIGGWMNEWMGNGYMPRWVDRQVEGCGWLDGYWVGDEQMGVCVWQWMGGGLDGWMAGWVDADMDGGMDGGRDGCGRTDG